MELKNVLSAAPFTVSVVYYLASILVPYIFVLSCYWLVKKKWHTKLEATGRVVVITGCDSGVGYSIAMHCYKRGFTVIAMVLNEESNGAQSLKLLSKDSGQIEVVYMDVAKLDTIREAVRHVEEVMDSRKDLSFHGLINNAGVMVFGETEWLTEDMVALQLEVNLSGAINVTRLFAPLLRKYKGRVINISSHCASLPLPGFSVYAGTKAGLQAWSDGLRVEWSKYGITVITLLPGAFVQQTNILSQQVQHARVMKEAMSTDAATFYSNYFSTCQMYLSALSGEKPAALITCNRLYSLLDDALLSACPKVFYHITPWRYWFYHSLALCPLTPVVLRDWLASRFVQLPSFSPAN